MYRSGEVKLMKGPFCAKLKLILRSGSVTIFVLFNTVCMFIMLRLYFTCGVFVFKAVFPKHG